MSKRPYKVQASSTRVAFGTSNLLQSNHSSSSIGEGTFASQLSYLTEPPNLEQISDPGLVVLLKNLSKREGITKAKALDDILGLKASAKIEVDDHFVEAWTKLYARLSIDTHRQVRQLAHRVNGVVTISAGKGIARFMPKICPPWLAGLYDNDKGVSKAAQEALTSLFSSKEKLIGLRKAYQQPILLYCTSVIRNETVDSLSDARTSSTDDAEAKYARTVATSICLLQDLLQILPLEDRELCRPLYNEILTSEKLWAFVSANDSYLARSTCKIFPISFNELADNEARTKISSFVLYNILTEPKENSICELSDVLVYLTETYPLVWNTPFRKWCPKYQSLEKIITSGQRAKPVRFWKNLEKIIRSLPSERLPSDAGSALELLGIVQEGVEKNSRSFWDDITVWKAYFQILQFVSSQLSFDDQVTIARLNAWPLVVAYVKLSPNKPAWQTNSPETFEVITKILFLNAVQSIAIEEWLQITKEFGEKIQTLPPEQSKHYGKAQEQIVVEGYRWSSVQRLLFKSEAVSSARKRLDQALMDVLKTSLDVIQAREGKHFGAAGISYHLIEQCHEQVTSLQPAQSAVAAFVKETLPMLIQSPSSKFLSRMLYAQINQDYFENAWILTLNIALKHKELRRNTLMNLLDSSIIPQKFCLPKSHGSLQKYIHESFSRAFDGRYEWDDLLFALHNVSMVLSDENQESLIFQLLLALQSCDRKIYAIEALKIVLNGRNTDFLMDVLTKSSGHRLLSELILVSDSLEERVAEDADQIQRQLRLISRDECTGIEHSAINVIQLGLGIATKSSLSVERLVSLAKDLIRQAITKSGTLAMNLMPSADNWNDLLNFYTQIPLADDLKITSGFGGAISLVLCESDGPDPFTESMVSTDNQGLTKIVRIAKYFAAMCHGSEILQMLEESVKVDLYRSFVITMQLLDDDLTLAGVFRLWDKSVEDVKTDILQFTTDSNGIINGWSQRVLEREFTFVKTGIVSFYDNANGLLPKAFHYARALAYRTAELIELHGPQKCQELLPFVDDEVYKQAQEDALIEAALITGLAHSHLLLPKNVKDCNNIVSDLIGTHAINELTERKAFKSLITLNLTFTNNSSMVKKIAKQRLIFLVKQLISWLCYPMLNSIKREILEILAVVLPLNEEVYGSHWSDTMAFLLTTFESFAKSRSIKLDHNNLPLLYSSLKLFAKLQSLSDKEDVNEDLLDSWKELAYDAIHYLLALFKKPQEMPDEDYLPLKVLNELLCRQILLSKCLQLGDVYNLFTILNSQSKILQETAFRLLHRRIPMMQEQISVDAAIENRKASLSDQLTSVLKVSPKILAQSSLEIDLRGYLLAWILLFDHFEFSSLKVRFDYTQDVKDGGYLIDFLDIMSEFLGHKTGKSFDASKIDLKEYILDNKMSARKDTQWLLSHIYYLALVNVASLVKAWWLDCNSRQTATSIESWTKKHVTPLVIEKTLSTVIEWVESQDTESEDYLTVVVNSRVNEISASYPIDEQWISIVIRFPDAFPLSQALVDGVNRVAVEEKKWQAWLRSTQGVIAFQNNSIVDGLIAWRRNVIGALKGQTECAICYSIISADKQLPSKKCSTCKKLFHSNCLFKWFKSSSSSSCPLCRNPFNYG